MLNTFFEDIREGGIIAPRRLAERLHLPMTGLSRLTHVSRSTLTAKAGSPKVQTKLGEIARIIARAAELSGDEGRAIIWFRHQPIEGFGSTAEELVEQGHFKLVLEHLERVEAGVPS